MKTRVNERGNTVTTEFCPADRYLYDFRVCTSDKGWKQYDTDQDAPYFGIWVHVEKRVVFSYVEGDCTTVECPTQESFVAELASMAEFYGPPPPACIVYDLTAGIRTEIYDKRPE